MAQCLTRGTVASFVRAYYLSFSYIMNKSIGRFSHFKSCAPFLSLYIAKQLYLHTLTYTGFNPLWITGNDSATASYDFENTINLAEDEGEDDCEVPGELARLLLQEERAIRRMKSQWK